MGYMENKKFIITIVILILIILGLGSFIYYDKFYIKERVCLAIKIFQKSIARNIVNCYNINVKIKETKDGKTNEQNR